MIDYMKEFNSTYNSKDLAEMIENFKLGDDQEKNKINLEYWEKAYSKVKEYSKAAMIKLLRKDYFSTVFEFKDNCRIIDEIIDILMRELDINFNRS